MATASDTVSVSIRKAQLAEATRLAEESARDPQAVLEELLEESIRMRRVPGIVFADGATGRRARIAGTGLDVWEIVSGYKSVGWDVGALKQAFDWLNERQIAAALSFYAAYPLEIDARIRSEEEFDIETFWAEHPRSRPPWR